MVMTWSWVTALTEREKKKTSTFKYTMWPLMKKVLHGSSHADMHANAPGKEDAFYHFKVLHEHVSFWLLAQASHTVCDAQLNGTFQSRRCCLKKGSSGGHMMSRIRTCWWAIQKNTKKILLELLYVNFNSKYNIDTCILFEGLQKTFDLIKLKGRSNNSRPASLIRMYLPIPFIGLYLLHGAIQITDNTTII